MSNSKGTYPRVSLRWVDCLLPGDHPSLPAHEGGPGWLTFFAYKMSTLRATVVQYALSSSP